MAAAALTVPIGSTDATGHGPQPSAATPGGDIADAPVIAQGLIWAGTGDHVWFVGAHHVTDLLTRVPSGPMFVMPQSGAIRVETGHGYGAYLEPGEAQFVPTAAEASFEVAEPADVLEVGVQGGTGDGAFPLTEGSYDFELIRGVLDAGEQLQITDAAAALVLAVEGVIGLADGSVLSAGFNTALSGDFALRNDADGGAVVLVAVIVALDAGTPIPDVPSTVTPGSTPTGSTPTPGGIPTPGGTSDSSPTPTGSTTPGTSPPATTPGPTTPGDTPTVPTAAPTTSPPTTSPPTTAAATPLSLTVVSMNCGASGGVNITVSAIAGSGFRRNVQSVTMARDNEFGTYISPTNANWMGPDTADKSWWTANQIGNRPDMGTNVRIIATADDGRTATITETIPAACH